MAIRRLIRNSYFWAAGMAVLLAASAASAATFGKVVPTGGHAADIALDESRGVLYIADFTASRVEVMSLASNTISRSISVPGCPGSLALSPDSRYLAVAHYASSSNNELYPYCQNQLTALDLTTGERRTFLLSAPPLGVAFGNDRIALVLTAGQFLLFDPAAGTATVLATLGSVVEAIPDGMELPLDPATYPPEAIAAQLTTTPDRAAIFGIAAIGGNGGEQIRFSYSTASRRISAADAFTSAPELGPRVISTSTDGSYYMTGWTLFQGGTSFGERTAQGPLLAQWPNSSGDLNVGSVAIRPSKALIYAQLMPKGKIPASTNTQATCLPNGTCVQAGVPSSTSDLPPTLLILDADNLTVRDRVQIPENLAGRSVFSSDESTLYSISDSGVTVFSMPLLDQAPRVLPSTEDVVFRGNFCNSGPITQKLDIYDPAGNATPFQICVAGSSTCTTSGIAISPSSGVTPAQVKITFDPSTLGSFTGTKAYQIEIRSSAAINMPPPPSRGATETYVPNVRSRFRLLLNNRAPENRGTFFNVAGTLMDVVADPARNRFYVLRQDKNQVQVFDSKTYALTATLRTSNTPTQMAMTLDWNYLLVAHDNSQLAYRFDLRTDPPTPVDPIVFALGHYPRSIAVSANAILASSRLADGSAVIDRVQLASLTGTKLPSLGVFKNSLNGKTTLAAAPNGATILAGMPDGNLMLYDASADSFTISRKDVSSLSGSLAASNYGNYIAGRSLLNKSLVSIATIVDDADKSSGFAFVDRDGFSAAVRSTGAGYMQRTSSSDGQQVLATGTVEAPLVGDAEFPFTRTLAPLADGSAIVALTTSGFTVLPWNYDAATAPPVLSQVVSAADFSSSIATGGLVSLLGSQLSSLSMASAQTPLPTMLGDSCVTVNGSVIPMLYVSPGQINAQLPYHLSGAAKVVLHSPGGVSDALDITVEPSAPTVFRWGTAGPYTGIASITREANNSLVTPSNPVHMEDRLTIYVTGLGETSPPVDAGAASPAGPLALAVSTPTVTLGGVQLSVESAGLAPGMVGVGQIEVKVPFRGVPTGFSVPLEIVQGGSFTSIPVRVVD